MIDLFYDKPAHIFETDHNLIIATSQNTTSLNLNHLSGMSINELVTNHRSSTLRNESMLLIHKHNMEINAITDPIGFSKLFLFSGSGFRVISSHLSCISSLSNAINLPACLSYLLNGSVINDKTIFRDISTLRRACLHSFTSSHTVERCYWDFTPGRSGGPRRTDEHAQQSLWDSIVASVRDQCGNKRVLLALSGGTDSSILLGALGKAIKHQDVMCFSYVNGCAAPGSDAYVAERQAKLFGYRHVSLDISSTTLTTILQLNTRSGQSQRTPCLELESFLALRNQINVDDNTIMAFGDESWGQSSFTLRNHDDVLGASYLLSPAGLNKLSSFTTYYNKDLFDEILYSEYENLLAESSKFTDFADMADYLCLDYRLNMNILPLRTFSIASWFDVCNPLLDTRVIDQVSAFTPAQRLNKSLVKRMGRTFLPELFAIPRASHRQVALNFLTQIVPDYSSLREQAEHEVWRIPDLFDGDEIKTFLDTIVDRNTFGVWPYRSTGESIRRLLSSLGVLERVKRVRRESTSPFNQSPSQVELLIRVLSLAQQTPEKQRGPAKSLAHSLTEAAV